MATLEDAAEALVVKLRGLDSEIEESERGLEAWRGKVEGVASQVEREWSTLTEAAHSFLERVRQEAAQLERKVDETLQALADSHQAAAENGGQARTEVAGGQGRVEALGQHADGLPPGVRSLAEQAGQSPARALSQRARELELELERMVGEARDFLRHEVVAGVAQMTDEARQACDAIHRMLAEETTAALQEAYGEWESKVDELETYVATQGFQASHEHARAVVDFALEECRVATEKQLVELRELAVAWRQHLDELSGHIDEQAARHVAGPGSELVGQLEQATASASAALAALDRVKQELAAYSFVEV
jgi:hypothetical protein